MRVTLVTDDLLARSRVEEAARAAGVEVVVVKPGLVPQDRDLVLVDLEAVAADLAPYADMGAVGFFSHINGDLAADAREAGITPMPRGRFWRSLPGLLGASDQSSAG